jgi:hypothetical protein
LRTIIRTKRWLQITGIAAIVASAGMVQSVAAQGESLTVEVGECVDLPTPEQRLACFEAQVEAARRAPAEAAPAAPSSAGPAAAAQVAPSSTAPAAAPVTTTIAVPPDSGRRGRDEEAPPPADIFATVAELRETVPNSYLITLNNGQVWRQTQPDYYPLRPGSTVRIYYSRWKSFRLTNEELNGFIQVERVR